VQAVHAVAVAIELTPPAAIVPLATKPGKQPPAILAQFVPELQRAQLAIHAVQAPAPVLPV